MTARARAHQFLTMREENMKVGKMFMHNYAEMRRRNKKNYAFLLDRNFRSCKRGMIYFNAVHRNDELPF